MAPREPPHLFSQWTSLTPALSRAESLAIFLDFDGTLAGIRRRPDDVHLSPVVCRLLSRLAGQGHLLGIVSGRPLDDLERKVGLPGVWYVGVHGFFLRAPGRKPTTFATRTERADIARATACLRRDLGHVPGLLIEPKIAAVAVHYRGARARARALASSVVHRVVRKHPRLRLMAGNRVWEVLPVDVVDKFNAVQRILRADRAETTTPRRVAIYVGDDITDESVFRKFSGLSVVVGRRRPTHAKFALESPWEVREFLRRLEVVGGKARQAKGQRRARGPCIDAAVMD